MPEEIMEVGDVVRLRKDGAVDWEVLEFGIVLDRSYAWVVSGMSGRKRAFPVVDLIVTQKGPVDHAGVNASAP